MHISPGGNKARKVGCLIEVDPFVSLRDEPRLFGEGPDHTGTLHRLIEVGVDGRAAHSLQPAQLTGCGNVEALWATVEKGKTSFSRPH